MALIKGGADLESLIRQARVFLEIEAELFIQGLEHARIVLALDRVVRKLNCDALFLVQQRHDLDHIRLGDAGLDRRLEPQRSLPA